MAPDAPGANEGTTSPDGPEANAVAPATSPDGAGPTLETPVAVTGTSCWSCPTTPEPAGTMARKPTATTIVMSKPRPMPMAVWR